MSLMAAMFFVSCDQNSADDEVQGGISAYQVTANSQAKYLIKNRRPIVLKK